MRRIYFLFCCFMGLVSLSQLVVGQCNGIIYLNSQEDIDNFAVDYGCTEVEGSLVIDEQIEGDITNLLGLSEITSIGQRLTIESNNNLLNLDGLNSLTSIGSKLEILYNNELSNVDGLSSLISIDGSLNIIDNYNLSNLDGLNALTSINGSLIIQGNDALTHLDNFNSITTIDYIRIEENDTLMTIGGFSSLTSLTSLSGHLFIVENSSLTSISGFNSLEYIPAYFHIYNNTALITIEGFNLLHSIGTSFKIWENNVLATINGFSSLTSVGARFMIGNTALSNLDNFSSLTSIGSDFFIKNNTNLTNIDGLNSLTYIDNNLIIENNILLNNIDGLSSLTSTENISIINNTELVNVDGLILIDSLENLEIIGNVVLLNVDGLSSLTIIENINVEGNTSLTNVDGLSSITSIENINVEGNTSLTNVDGLSSLTSIENLDIVGNTSLINVGGLSSLTTIENLNIEGNTSLTNVDGFSSVTEIEDLDIKDNNSLINVDGFCSVTEIKNLNVDGNASLTNLDGFNATNVYGYLAIIDNDALTNLDGFSASTSVYRIHIEENDALISINGFTALDTLEWFFAIQDNSSLLTINGFNALAFTGYGLHINNNDALMSIDGFNNLNNIGYELHIKENDVLVSINAFINLIGIGRLDIKYNPMLSDCCVILYLSTLTENINIVGNALGCNSLEEVLASACDYTTIKIVPFYDENSNGIFEQEEYHLYNFSFIIDPMPVYTSYDSSNTTIFYIDTITSIQYDNTNNGLWTVINDPEAYTIEAIGVEDTTLYFPMEPITNFWFQSVDVTSSITRCNQQTNIWLTYTNNSSQANSGYVNLIADSLTSFISSIPPVDSIAGDTLYWFYENLYPTHSAQIHAIFEMAGPGVDGENVGKNLVFESEIETWEGEGEDKFFYNSELICAYDPNDKLVNPKGIGGANYTLFSDSLLNYTIRFQNTGNDTAFNIIIRDTISEYLDLSSYRFTTSSHEMSTEINLSERIIEFHFNNIELPDSNINEPASHGLVKFSLIAKENIAEGTVIENTAGIYFDFNPPIVTNTTFNTFVESYPAGVSANIKVFLEGGFDPLTGLMKTTLRTTELLPLTQPFVTIPYNYTGAEAFTSIDDLPINAVDWVLVEARSGMPNTMMASTIIVESIAGILLADGSIVSVDGQPLIFNNLVNGQDYYFVVRHRNHLDIIAANPVTASTEVFYDFTTARSQAFGDFQQIMLPNGKAAMYVGDYNQDGTIQVSDYDTWIFFPSQIGIYESTDGTLDGVIQLTDFDAWRPNKAKLGSIEIQF